MRRNKLDYSYGESGNKSGDVDVEIVDNDENVNEFAVKGKNGSISIGNKEIKKADEKKFTPPVNMEPKKYLHYEEFVQNNDYESNGYKVDANDDFKKLDVRGWNMFLGFMFVRILSPLILVVHAIAAGVYVYMLNFDFSPEGPLAIGPYGGIGAIMVLSLSVHAFLVHFINKWAFSSTYWKKRVDFEREKREASIAKTQQSVSDLED